MARPHTRFVKFGLVGASGMVINLAVMYLGQELLFRGIAPLKLRLNLSLALAIFIATISNFTWNRLWTWRDRRSGSRRPLPVQFGQYALACWVGIVLQLVFTNLLALYLKYLVANFVSIVVSGVLNFAVNDLWTFRFRRGDG